MPELAHEIDRHHRQSLLPQIGPEGTGRLRQSHALIVGVGALGSVVADSLVRAGVGRLTLIDRDVVELTNLQRQILFTEAEAREGLPKAEAARRRLREIDSTARLDAVVDDLNPANAERLIDSADPPHVLIDGTDNFETRFLLNDIAVKHGVPFVSAGVVGVTGTQCTILPRGECAPWNPTPCLRCLLPEPPDPASLPTCDTAGVLAPAVSIVASFETVEAMKILLARFDDVRRTLLEVDVWTGRIRHLRPHAPDPDCPCCAHRRFDYLEGDGFSGIASLCGLDAIQITPTIPARAAIDLERLAETLRPHGDFTRTPFLMRGDLRAEKPDSGDSVRITIFPTGRAIVSGVRTTTRARAIYARYVGA